MSTSAEELVLVDTSVAVALVVADHEHHAATMSATRGLTLGLAGHARFETYSVLTRLPPPNRRAPTDVARMIEHDFPASRFLDPEAQRRLVPELVELGLAGGAAYDALVGAAARQHGLPLLTRDRRAVDVYRRLGVEVRVVGDRVSPA